MLHPRRAIVAKTGIAASVIVIAAAVPGIALGAGGKTGNQSLPESVLTTVFQRTANDAGVAATVDGEPVSQRAVRQQAQLLSAQKPGLALNAARKAAFQLVAQDAAAYAEAKRLGLQISQADAQKFTDYQRSLYDQENPQEKLPTSVAIRSSGLTESAFWQQQVNVYARGMLVGKLRQQVLEQHPEIPPAEQAKYWQDFLNRLLSSAHVVYVDKSLQ